ncbi:hypothetical protein ACMXYV_00485 [Neptuniibacter sp. SY11_33]|uniref:hypothetical protein n=1 Tax=Neptuniibacter sp. SY11_33 TaxID=3398215 RepID=UPI0039F55406
MQIAKQIEPGFSTADAEYPVIRQEDGDLTLCFKDWQENSVEVFFGDVIAFKWQMVESFLANERDDCSYEIEGSEWLDLHRKQGEVESEEYKHYKFNFNAIGQFEVLALCYIVKT